MLLLMEKHSCSILCISYITVRLYYRTRFATEFNNNHIQAWTVLQLVCSKIFSEQSISRALMSQQRLDYHPWSRSWDSWPARTRPFNKFYRSVTSQLFVVWHILYCRHLWYAHASCCKRIYCSAGNIRHRVTFKNGTELWNLCFRFIIWVFHLSGLSSLRCSGKRHKAGQRIQCNGLWPGWTFPVSY